MGWRRLTRVSWRPAGGQWHVTDFTYDGLGRRVKFTETTNNVATTNTFVWCGTELCEERNSSGATVNKRFFGQGEQISGTVYFFTRDHLGSIREMVNSGGTIQARYEYDPYGRRTKVSGSSESDFAYTGHYYHQKSGLHLAPYRAYDSETARWISRDPLGEGDGLNLYAYVRSNPVSATDPLGLYYSSIKTPTGVAVMQWAAGGVALGAAARGIIEAARQKMGDCPFDLAKWNKVVFDPLSMLQDAILGVIFGSIFTAAMPWLVGGVNAAKATPGADDIVKLFHQGNLRGGQVSASRPLSTSTSTDLAHYNPSGRLYEFHVPRSTLKQWEQQELVRRFQDWRAPSGIISSEIRIMPPASGQLNQFLVSPAP